MLNIEGIPEIPKPQNAPMPGFARGTPERKLLEEAIKELRSQDSGKVKLPLMIGGKEIMTRDLGDCIVPHDNKRLLGKYARAQASHTEAAIQAALDAREKWHRIPWYMRLNIFRKAAYLLQTKHFYKLVAATMEDLSKNPYEAMIDVCELVDFWNFNAYYAYQIYREQPDSQPSSLNFTDWRPLEGFVAALSPNNFVAIAGNLGTAPAMMGNVVVCKPASDTVFSFHAVLDVLYEAGLPPEVLSVVHGGREASQAIGETLLGSSSLAGVHFTGGTSTFDWIVGRIGKNTEKGVYRYGYPHRSCVGETGGKDFIIVHDDADARTVAAAIVVGGFGCQGRKCSATSRIYVTEHMWPAVSKELAGFISSIKAGDAADFRNYMAAIISEAEYKKIVGYIEAAKADKNVEVIGGSYTDKPGWFIRPTLIVTRDPDYRTMKEEIFGPVVTICPMSAKDFRGVLAKCDETSPYGLTGAINTASLFTLCEGLEKLRYAAGNIYDWKTTGAVVGQQPFGGARKSGTDDKGGSKLNLYKWVSSRSISLLHNRPQVPWPAFLDLQ